MASSNESIYSRTEDSTVADKWVPPQRVLVGQNQHILSMTGQSEPCNDSDFVNGQSGISSFKQDLHTDKSKTYENEKRMKQHVHGIYEDLEKFMKSPNINSNLRDEIVTEFGDIDVKIKEHKHELLEEYYPIVVTGETSAGKSSFINLLIGSDILPYSVLTCTSVICRLMNRSKKAVYLIDTNNETIQLDIPANIEPVAMKKELKKYVNIKCADTQKYKYVDIHWPIPILQEHAIIVDTPGIGTSEDLTARLMEYLPKAISMIYLIKSSNAGGVQSDRLLKIFESQSKNGNIYNFDPTRAIFICNMWDLISEEDEEEEEEVWNHIKNELANVWPKFKPEAQMYKLSAKQELKRSVESRSKDYKDIVQAIEKMIPASFKGKIGKHLRWQKCFLEHVLKRVVGRIKLSRKTEEENTKIKGEVDERIKRLRHNIEEVCKRVQEKAMERSKSISLDLYEHLNSKETRRRIFLWSVPELPHESDFDLIEYKGKKIILERITSETRDWCKSQNVENLSKELSDLFRTECKLIESQCHEINNLLLGVGAPLDKIVNKHSENKSDVLEPLFTKQETVVLAVSSPLWLPLIVGAGLIALPFGAVVGLKSYIKQRMKISDYNSNKLKFMMEWTDAILKDFNEDKIYTIIEDTYLGNFNKNVKHVCETLIPLQLDADEKFINNIKQEICSSSDSQKQFQPVEYFCKTILGKVLLMELDVDSEINLSSDCISYKKRRDIGKGQFSDVQMAEVFIEDSWIQVAVKTMRKPLEKSQSFVQLTEVQTLRKLRHPNIVRFLGISYSTDDQTKKFLQIFMEYCDDNLENIVFKKTDPVPCYMFKDISFCKNSWQFYLSMMCGICNGLLHIHKLGIVHRDMKLANILVKDGEAKIADMGLAKEEEVILGTVTGTPTTMSPETLKGDFYGTESDIFSVGIILWEMWYARPAYTFPSQDQDGEYELIAKSRSELGQYIITGKRPDFESNYRPQIELQGLMKKCWDGNAMLRPTAGEVLNILLNMKLSSLL